MVKSMVDGSIISSCQWKDVDKRRHERGLCHHVGILPNQLLLTCINCEGLILIWWSSYPMLWKIKSHMWCHVPKECEYQSWR